MNLKYFDFKHWAPFIIALAVALIGALYYIISGHSNLDLNTRELEKSPQVEKTLSTEPNTITVKCKNGESYKIVYKQGQTNFQDLVYNKCGADGAENQTP